MSFYYKENIELELNEEKIEIEISPNGLENFLNITKDENVYKYINPNFIEMFRSKYILIYEDKGYKESIWKR